MWSTVQYSGIKEGTFTYARAKKCYQCSRPRHALYMIQSYSIHPLSQHQSLYIYMYILSIYSSAVGSGTELGWPPWWPPWWPAATCGTVESTPPWRLIGPRPLVSAADLALRGARFCAYGWVTWLDMARYGSIWLDMARYCGISGVVNPDRWNDVGCEVYQLVMTNSSPWIESPCYFHR